MDGYINEYPRLVIPIPTSVHEELNKLIPRGMKSQVFRILCEDLLVLLRENPNKTLSDLLARRLRLADFPTFRP